MYEEMYLFLCQCTLLVHCHRLHMPALGNRVISYSWFKSNPNSSGIFCIGRSAKVAKRKPYLEKQFSVRYVHCRGLAEVTKLANSEATDFVIDTR